MVNLSTLAWLLTSDQPQTPHCLGSVGSELPGIPERKLIKNYILHLSIHLYIRPIFYSDSRCPLTIPLAPPWCTCRGLTWMQWFGAAAWTTCGVLRRVTEKCLSSRDSPSRYGRTSFHCPHLLTRPDSRQDWQFTEETEHWRANVVIWFFLL